MDEKKSLRETIADMPTSQKVMIVTASALVVGGGVMLYLRKKATDETVRGLIEASVSS
jgi:hypothetical protein